jgi:hypothetical protein
MAILTQDDNKIEVRIKRLSDGTYFDEYVKIGDREKPDAVNYERYIVPEPGTMYEIEVTLKKGYRLNGCNGVMAQLIFPGQSAAFPLNEHTRLHTQVSGIADPTLQDITLKLAQTGVIVSSGKKIHKACLSFRQIAIGTFSILQS